MTADEPEGRPDDDPGGEAEFSVDPQIVIWELVHALVRGERV